MTTVLKKNFLVLSFLMMLITSRVFSEPQGLLPGIDIRELSLSVSSGRDIPEIGSILILDGTVLERRLINPAPEEYLGEIILASGEWINGSEIAMHSCIILLEGPAFVSAIPARRSRTVPPDEITVNSELLVTGEMTGIRDTPDGPRAVVKAVAFRRL